MASTYDPAVGAGAAISGFNTRPSALTAKVTSVLSTSYADTDIRSALEILDQQGFRNTSEARRQLRLHVQKEVIDCNGAIIKDFGRVAERLKKVGTVITRLNQRAQQISAQVSAANQEIAPVMDLWVQLINDKEHTRSRIVLVQHMIATFIAPDALRAVLTSSETPVDDEFFKALSRVKIVIGDSRLLLTDGSQRLGTDVISSCIRILNEAFDKLYTWVYKEMRKLDLEDPQETGRMRQALRALAERPNMFRECLDAFSKKRERVLSEAYMNALLGDVKSPNPSPIQLYAHDPLRYIGDLLAHVHSAAVSEKESLQVLFVDEGGEPVTLAPNEYPRADAAAGYDGKKELNDLINRNLAYVDEMLKRRVEQVLANIDSPTTMYKMSNLLSFYQMTFERLLGGEAPLGVNFKKLGELARDHIHRLLREQGEKLKSGAIDVPTELGPPAFLETGLEQLQELSKSYEVSIAPVSSQTADFRPILTAALGPYLFRCKETARALEQPRSSIFLLNCYLAVKKVVMRFTFAEQCGKEIDDVAHEHVQSLTMYQHIRFRQESGVDKLLAATAATPATDEGLKRIRTLPEFELGALEATSRKLDSFLPTAVLDANKMLEQLGHLRIRHEITNEAAKRFCQDFEFVERLIVAADECRDVTVQPVAYADEDGESEPSYDQVEVDTETPLRAVFPRTTAEIRVLLLS